MPTLAEMIVDALADQGVTHVWGVVGDALNPITDAIRRHGDIEWVGVRHEEVAAFAAGAQAQLTGGLGVCMGTVGPGSIHLLNGLYDAKKSHAPVLAICGQVPSAEIGSEFFQEVNNDVLFADVAEFARSLTSVNQMPHVLEHAVNAALAKPGVAVLTIPGDIGAQDVPADATAPRFAPAGAIAAAPEAQIRAAAAAINAAGKVAILAGMGARAAREQTVSLARKLQAPMVLTLKGKEGLERDNPYQVGQTGLLGNPAAAKALDDADTLILVGTDFPYREWYPQGKTVVQIDTRPEHIGRRVHVSHALVGHAGPTLDVLLPHLTEETDPAHLDAVTKAYRKWCDSQQKFTDPPRSGIVRKLRGALTNPGDRIRPEALAAALDTHADPDAVFTVDTGMCTAWVSRFVSFDNHRRLLGSFNLGSMANAMPQALGAQMQEPNRQVIACAGDGGFMMLLGDLRTAVTYELPVKIVVFNNGSLGMVKLEQNQGGLPEFGTELDNPDFAEVARAMGLDALQVTEANHLDEGIQEALSRPGPVLIDVHTNPEEIAVPPKVTAGDVWGFAIAKSKEFITSP